MVEISALKGTGIKEAAEKAVKLAESKKVNKLAHKFSDEVESVIEAVEDKIGLDVVEEQKRFFAIKLLEKDDKIGQLMSSVPDVTSEMKSLRRILMMIQKVLSLMKDIHTFHQLSESV